MRLNTSTVPWRWPPEVTVESRFKLLGGQMVSVTSLDEICFAVFILVLMISSVLGILCTAVLEWGAPTQIAPSCRNMHRNGSIYLFCAQFFNSAASLHSEFITELCFSAPTSVVQQIGVSRKIQLGVSHPTSPDFYLDRYVAPCKWKIDKTLMCK